jgi:hypothetical protein
VPKARAEGTEARWLIQKQEGEMAEVEVYGWGTVLRIIRLTKKQLTELTKKGATEERLQDLEYEAKFSTGRSGFAPEGFSVLVDGKEVDREVLGEVPVQVSADEALDKRYSYLIIEETQKGCWVSVKSRKKFRPELLNMYSEALVLPDGSRYVFMELSFDGKDVFGSTEGKNVEVFVVTAKGERHEIETHDEE